MFTVALILSLICLAVPVFTFVRMVVTARRVRAEIHWRMSAHRRHCCGHQAESDHKVF